LEKKAVGNILFKMIITAFLEEKHFTTKALFYEVVRGFLDTLHIGPEELPQSQILADINAKIEEEKRAIISVFYQEFALMLFEPLFKEPPDEHDPIETFTKSSLCDLLSFFVDHHAQETKLFILKYNIIPKLFVLLKAKEKNLLLGPIRVLRRMISSNKLYHNYIVQNNLFAPVIQVFLDNGDKYNALNSSILDIFHFIGSPKNSCRSLVIYFVENFYEKVKDVAYVQTFKNLSILYENPEPQPEDNKIAVDAIREQNRQKFREEDLSESWFDSDDDFSSTSLSNSNGSMLVEENMVEKRKYGPEDETNLQDSPRPKRFKFSSADSSDSF
jgi:protein phosphatase-4 regulatory subunit 3